jgi:hypothetical protein
MTGGSDVGSCEEFVFSSKARGAEPNEFKV